MRLSIPTPCTQDWEAMAPAGQGRHCAACQKVVVDFSRMTDEELVTWMQTRAGQEICGRLETGQLGRELVSALPLVRKQPWWSWARVSAAAGALWLVLAGSSGNQQVQAQNKAQHSQRLAAKDSRLKHHKGSEQSKESNDNETSIMGDVLADSATLRSEYSLHTVVDVMPEPQYNAVKYIGDAVKAPGDGSKEEPPSRFIVRFVVMKSGEIRNVEIVKGYNPDWDESLRTIFLKMTPWKPGLIKGKPVNTQVTFPFTLHWVR